MKPLIVNIGKVDIPNANGRVYPRRELERAILDINQDNITRGQVFGQVGMPSNGHSRAELDKVAFIVGNLIITEAGDFNGEVVWLATPAGEKAKAMYETSPDTWFFRTCGVGKLNDNEIVDYRILSINMVLNGA